MFGLGKLFNLKFMKNLSGKDLNFRLKSTFCLIKDVMMTSQYQKNNQKFCYEKTFDLIYYSTFYREKCIFLKNDVIMTSQYRKKFSLKT